MAEALTPLEVEIRRRIAMAGPMPVGQYMRLCLTHPDYGYYMTRDPFGTHGDFITAPEISQMFGELIGLWAGSVWRQMGSPQEIRLVELGPGRGSMMKDALRAAHVMPEFRAALAPIGMRQYMVTAHFPAGFNLTARRHRPMKERVESRHAHAAGRGFHMFEKG